jgi:hypothetical protein
MLLRTVIETIGRTLDFEAALSEIAARYADIPAENKGGSSIRACSRAIPKAPKPQRAFQPL